MTFVSHVLSGVFTFHYVSIKTNYDTVTLFKIMYLHSTMYLLKLLASVKRNAILLFTFHYVSIKTKRFQRMNKQMLNLHSTMYLLKRAK